MTISFSKTSTAQNTASSKSLPGDAALDLENAKGSTSMRNAVSHASKAGKRMALSRLLADLLDEQQSSDASSVDRVADPQEPVATDTTEAHDEIVAAAAVQDAAVRPEALSGKEMSSATVEASEPAEMLAQSQFPSLPEPSAFQVTGPATESGFADWATFATAVAVGAVNHAMATRVRHVPVETPAAEAPPGPVLQSMGVAGETSVDVRTHIVLNFDVDIARGSSGKFIRIVDDGLAGAGFHGEGTVNTQTFAASDAAITIVGNRVVIDLPFDLDFSSRYHVEFDAGAFVSATRGGAVQALTGQSQSFTTVAPSASSLSTGSASVIDDGSGAVIASSLWWDLEGRGTSAVMVGVQLNAASGANVYVVPDHEVEPANPGTRVDGVGVNDFYVELINFGANDLVYADNLGRNNTVNHPVPFHINAQTEAPTSIVFAPWRPTPSSEYTLGGEIDIYLEGPGNRVFTTVAEWQAALGMTTAPYVAM